MVEVRVGMGRGEARRCKVVLVKESRVSSERAAMQQQCEVAPRCIYYDSTRHGTCTCALWRGSSSTVCAARAALSVRSPFFSSNSTAIALKSSGMCSLVFSNASISTFILCTVLECTIPVIDRRGVGVGRVAEDARA